MAIRETTAKTAANLIILTAAASTWCPARSAPAAPAGPGPTHVDTSPALDKQQHDTLDAARLLYEKGRFKQAEPLLDMFIKQLPADGDGRRAGAMAFLFRGEIREKNQQYAKALQDMHQFERLSPSARWGSAILCRILAEGGDYKDAIARLKESIFSRDDHARPHALLAICSACLQDFPPAEAHLSEAIKLHFGQHDLDVTDGPYTSPLTMQRLHKWCENRLKEKPKESGLFFAMGVIDTLSQNYKKAIDEYTACLKATPSMHETFVCRAECFICSKNYPAGLDDINHAIALAPSDPGCYKALEHYYTALGNFDKYLAELDRLSVKYPGSAAILAAKARANEKIGESEKALEGFNRAVKINPSDTDALNGRGKLYVQLFKYKEGIADFSQAIKLLPTDPNPYRDRAKCYLEQGKEEETIADISKVIELTHDPKAYAARARCNRRRGQVSLAAADQRAADQGALLTLPGSPWRR